MSAAGVAIDSYCLHYHRWTDDEHGARSHGATADCIRHPSGYRPESVDMLTWSHIPYDRELPRPIVTSHGEYRRRVGFLVRVETAQCVCGIGDVAPLPGFSEASADDAMGQWRSLQSRLAQLSLPSSIDELSGIIGHVTAAMPLYASLRFGIETALADCAARLSGLPLSQWLDADASLDIEVNALLRSQGVPELVAELQQRLDQGYSCFKIKVGVGDVADDVQRLRILRDHSSTARLRPDVNAGWNAEQLSDFCTACSDIGLEFIEQPLPVGEAEPARQIARECGVRLALDEDVTDTQIGGQLLQNDLCDVLVLKPMTIGGLTPCLQLAQVARDHGKQIVLTSSWESDVGVAATAHLAAACGDVAAASGLSTAGMMADGLVAEPLRIDHAYIRLPLVPGLGLELMQ
ncbi:MAG: o-succinylbenzoate synthase [candidate division Zixibacteria bacterium]|nr:o-succinylbenzoate synthase [candidate division Zixibacteria bacterium]